MINIKKNSGNERRIKQDIKLIKKNAEETEDKEEHTSTEIGGA